MNSVLFLFFFRLKFNISYYCESKFSSIHSLTIHLQRAISAQRKGSGRSRVGSGQPERRAEGKKNTTEFTTRMYFLNIFLSSFLEIITFEIFSNSYLYERSLNNCQKYIYGRSIFVFHFVIFRPHIAEVIIRLIYF